MVRVSRAAGRQQYAPAQLARQSFGSRGPPQIARQLAVSPRRRNREIPPPGQNHLDSNEFMVVDGFKQGQGESALFRS